MRKAVNYSIGFSDGEIYSYQYKEGSFIVFVKMWNGIKVRIKFSEVLGVCDFGVGDISAFVDDDNTLFLKSILKRNYAIVPISTPYRAFQFLNLDDEPALEVVAVDYAIMEEPMNIID